MGKVKVVLNRRGVIELLKSPEMVEILDAEAGAICKTLGTGYEHDTYIGPNRANASIRAESIPAKIDNMKNNSLLKAVGGSK